MIVNSLHRFFLSLSTMIICFGGGWSNGSKTSNESAKPSARIGYYWNSKADIDGTNSEFKHQEYTFQTGLFRSKCKAVTYGLGIKYRFNSMDFEDFSLLKHQQLHAIQIPFDFGYNPVASQWSWWLRLRPALMTDFDQLSEEDWSFASFFTGTRQLSERFSNINSPS